MIKVQSAAGMADVWGMDSHPEPEPATTDWVTRRTMLRWAGSAGALAFGATITQACAPNSDPGPVATADPADPADPRAADPPPATSPGAVRGPGPVAEATGLVLPAGFAARVVARGGSVVSGTSFGFRGAPDGAATFVDPAVPGGWYLTVNHELVGVGGVTSIRFAPDATITGARSICAATTMNCAGGATPWGTWLTCEEAGRGHVWECDPTGGAPAVIRPLMGAFAHEAAAVAADGRVYLTEDRNDGAFYRFTPALPGDLSAGVLEVATGPGRIGPVTWVPVPDPDPGSGTSCRHQVAGSIRFDGGEGICTRGDHVWFATKGDNRIWQYSLGSRTLGLRYQAGLPSPLTGVDNLWLDDASGALFVAEDGGDMEVVMLRADNSALPVIRVPGHPGSEITGPCFSPDGQRLYFSSQRGPGGSGGTGGVTYEVWGPFDELLGRR